MSKSQGTKKYDCPRCGDPCLSPTGHVRCGTKDEPEESGIVAKIRKLLALAEGTKYEEEAATAWAKAQELMQKHAIDEALLRESGGAKPEDVVVHVVPFVKRQARRARKLELLRVVASINRVRVIDDAYGLPPHLHAGMPARKEWDALSNAEQMKKFHDAQGVVHLVGLESDVTFTELLYMSALLQAWRFMSAAFVEHGVTGRKNAFGGAFLAGYNSRIAKRLAEQNRATEATAQRELEHRRPEASDGALVPTSVALALRNTRELVDQKVNEVFPNLRRGRGAGGGSDPVGYAAGQQAGARADITGGRRTMTGGSKRLTS